MRVKTNTAVRAFGFLAAGALAACADVSVPEGALLACETTDDCPDELVCEPVSLLCVPKRSGNELGLVSAVASDTRLGQPFIDAGAPVEIDVELTAAPQRAPSLRLVSGVADVATVPTSENADGTFSAQWTLTGDEPDGPVRVVVEAVDAIGVSRVLPTEVVIDIDTQPPHAVAVAVQRVPDPQLTPVAFEIAGERVVGPATAVRIVFSTDEPVLVDGDPDAVLSAPDLVVPFDDPRAPRVTTDAPVPLTFVRDLSVASPLLFDAQWPADPTGLDGLHAVVARLTDLAGNTSDELLIVDPGSDDGALILDVDATPPPPPSVDLAGAVRFERAPWGRLDVPAVDTFTVVGQPGSADPLSIVLITRDADGRAELGRSPAAADGSFGGTSLLLPTSDVPTVFVRSADRAGNQSTIVAVRDIAWFVTPIGKVAGDDVDNPHLFEDAGIFARPLGQGGFVERDASDGLGAVDDDPLVTVTGGTWRHVPPDDPQEPFQPVGASMAHDPVRGVSMLLGGVEIQKAFGPPGNFGTTARGQCGGARGDVWLRGLDDRWRLRALAPGEIGPPRQQGQLAFVPPLDGLVLVLSQGETWLFSDNAWELLCGPLACATADDFTVPEGLAWDPVRDVLVTTSGGRTLEWDGATWTAVGDAVGGTAITWDENLGRLVRFDGTTLWAWDGAVWSDACADAACAATRPSPRPGAQLAFDRVHQELVLFGGEAGVACGFAAAQAIANDAAAPQPVLPHQETWAFNGTTWRNATPAQSPPGRVGHAMMWDEARGAVVAVGGDDCACLGEPLNLTADFDLEVRGDTWEFDGATWTQVGVRGAAPAGFVRENPPPLRDHTLAEDPTHGGVLLVGGSTDLTQGASNDDLFVFRDDAWYRTQGDNGFPLGAFLPAVAVAPDGETILAAAGNPGSGGIGPIAPFHLRLEGNLVTLACPDDPTVPLCQMPQELWGASGFADEGRFWFFAGNGTNYPRVVGSALADVASNALVSWNEATGWITHCGGGACGAVPPPRIMQAMARTADGRNVLVGGLDAGNDVLGDSWIFDGTTWTEIQAPPPGAPPARYGHVVAYDAGRGTTLVTLGNDTPGPRQPGSAPVPPTPDAIAEALSDVWELVDGTWVRVADVDVQNDGRPTPRYGVSGAGRPGRGVVVYGGTPSPAQLLGGIPDVDFVDPVDEDIVTPRTDETWEWTGGDGARPALRVRVKMRVSRLDDTDELNGVEVTWRARSASVGGGTLGSDTVELLIWDGLGWHRASTDERVDCGADCHRAVFDAPVLKRALSGAMRELIVAAAPEATTGPAPGRVALETDFVEVKLLWRRPL